MVKTNIAMAEDKGKSKEEELRRSIGDLTARNNVLAQRLKECQEMLRRSNMENVLRRLDFLFKVLENGRHFSAEYLIQTTEEIMDLLYIPEKGDKGEEDGQA